MLFNDKLLPFTFFLFFFTVFYFLEIQNFNLNNQHLRLFNLFYNDFNFFLFNNLNKYHPGIFYTSVVLYLLLFLNDKLIFLKSSSLFFKNYISIENMSLIYTIFFVNAGSLFLGSWWAMQEGSWGGWWNWDASETLGLIVVFFPLYLLHFKLNKNVLLNLSVNLSFFFHISFLFYLFIQLGFDLTSHNFGIKSFFFFNNNFFIAETSLLIVIFTTFFIFNFFKNNLNYIFFMLISFSFGKRFIFKNFLGWIILVISLFFFVVSAGFLLNYFCWNFFQVNITNYEIKTFYVVVFLIVLYSVLMFKAYFLLLLLIVFYFSKSTLFFLMHPILLNTLHNAHLCIIYTLYANLFSSNLNYLVYYFSNITGENFFNLTFFMHTSKSLHLETFFIEPVLYHALNTFRESTWFNVNLFVNTQIDKFSLFNSNVYFFNLVYPELAPIFHFFLIQLFDTDKIFFFFFLFYFSIAWFKKTKEIKIIS